MEFQYNTVATLVDGKLVELSVLTSTLVDDKTNELRALIGSKPPSAAQEGGGHDESSPIAPARQDQASPGAPSTATGSAQQQAQPGASSTTAGSRQADPWYMAPEILRASNPSTGFTATGSAAAAAGGVPLSTQFRMQNDKFVAARLNLQELFGKN